MVKVAGRREVEVELWALRFMSSRGVPVPEVLGGAVDVPTPYLVSGFVEAPAGITTVEAARRAGELLRTIHRVPVEGAGFFKDSAGALPAAERGRWTDRVAGLAERLVPIAADGILGKQLFSACREHLLDAEHWSQPCGFVHGDLHPRHILSAGTRVESVIDWADCGAAPPWLDLATMDLGAADLKHALFDGYFPAGIPDQAAVHLANYRFLHRILALIWEYEGGGDWLRERVPDIEDSYAACVAPAGEFLG